MKRRSIWAAAIAAVLSIAAAPALAQTSPNLTYGQVPTAARGKKYFSDKQDTLGYTPLNTAGGIMFGRLITAPPSATTSGINLTPGSTPSSPVNGDMWATSVGLYVRINGSTVGPMTGPGSGSFAGVSPIQVTFPAGVVTYRMNYDSTFALAAGVVGLNLTNPNTWTGQQTFVAPVLGAATATSINKVALTPPATGSTLTLADGKTLTASNTLSFSGTDGTAFVLPPTNGTILTAASTATLTNKTFDTAGSGNSFSIDGLAATANTGTGSVVRATAPSISALTVTGSFTAAGLVTNTALATNTIANSKLVTTAPWTFKGNASASTATVQDFTVSSLTLKGAPGVNDLVLIEDSATGELRKTTTSAISVVGAVSSIDTATGALTLGPGLGRVSQALNAGGAVLHVADVAALQAVDTTVVTSAFIKDQGRAGLFVWKTGNFTNRIAADTNQGVYIKATAIAASSGAWVRAAASDGYFYSRWFGTIDDNSTDNSARVQTAINVMRFVNSDTVTALPGAVTAQNLTIERFVDFNIRNLTFSARQVLIYYSSSDTSMQALPAHSIDTSEPIRFVANANASGIVNENYCLAGSYAPGCIVHLRKDVAGQDSFLNGEVRQPTAVSPARASYLILDESTPAWYKLYQIYAGYGLTSPSNSVAEFTAQRRVTITAAGPSNVFTFTGPVGTPGLTQIQGLTSGARGIIRSCATSCTIAATANASFVVDWVSGTYQPGEQLYNFVSTAAGTVATAVLPEAYNTPVYLGTNEAVWSYGIPPGYVRTNATIAGSLVVQRTTGNNFGQEGFQTDIPCLYLADDVRSNANARALCYDTIGVAEANRRLTAHKSINNLGSVAYANAGGLTTHFTANHSGVTSSKSFNVISFGNVTLGQYRITFAAKASTIYQVGCLSQFKNEHLSWDTKTTTTVDIYVSNLASSLAAMNLQGGIDCWITGGDI